MLFNSALHQRLNCNSKLNLAVEELEQRQMLSTVQIFAGGTTGQEQIQLFIGDEAVATYSGLGDGADAGFVRTFTYETSEFVSADDVRIEFTNDAYTPGVLDRNVRIDAIAIDGVMYETESSAVFSTGTFGNNGLESGFGRGNFLHVNGFFQYSSQSVAASNLQIFAGGTTGAEQIQLVIDGDVVASYGGLGDRADDGFYQTFTYQGTEAVNPGDVRVEFINDFVYSDGTDRNVYVEAIAPNGQRFETNSAEVFSTGAYADGQIQDGFGRGNILHTNGFFEYGSGAQPVSTVQVFAAGETGQEQIQLVIGDDVVATYSGLGDGADAGDFPTFTYRSDEQISAEDVRIEFINDFSDANVDRNVRVDAIAINGERFETNSPNVFSTGTFANGQIQPGLGRGDILHVDGFFEYGANDQVAFDDFVPSDVGVTYYVSPNGSDDFSDEQAQDRSTPFQTISRAVLVARAGDTIIVADGTYNEEIFLNHSGTAEQDIVLRAESQHGAHIFGFIHGRDVSYITVEGFDVTNSNSGVISQSFVFYSSHHITIRNNQARDSFGGGIAFNQSDSILIEGNTTFGNAFFHPDAHSGISVYQPQRMEAADAEYGVIIRNNISYENANFVPNRNFGDGTVLTDGNGIILDDYFNSQPSGNGVVYDRRTLVENNIVFNNGGSGIQVFLANDIDIRNNTAVDNVSVLEFGGQISVSSSRDVNVYNNIASTDNGENAALQLNSSGVALENNILTGPVVGLPNDSNNIFDVDPQFVPGTFQLAAGSPAVDQGLNVNNAFGVDALGQNRSVGQIDIGAVERQG